MRQIFFFDFMSKIKLKQTLLLFCLFIALLKYTQARIIYFYNRTQSELTQVNESLKQKTEALTKEKKDRERYDILLRFIIF